MSLRHLFCGPFNRMSWRCDDVPSELLACIFNVKRRVNNSCPLPIKRNVCLCIFYVRIWPVRPIVVIFISIHLAVRKQNHKASRKLTLLYLCAMRKSWSDSIAREGERERDDLVLVSDFEVSLFLLLPSISCTATEKEKSKEVLLHSTWICKPNPSHLSLSLFLSHSLTYYFSSFATSCCCLFMTNRQFNQWSTCNTCRVKWSIISMS